MLAMIALSAAVTLGAADVKNEAWVVVTKRSGVAKPAALEMAKTVSETLSAKGVPNPTDVADLTSCNAKLICLVEAAMKKKVSVLITIETASVLDDVVIHSEALSIEEDGKKISTLDYEGPARQFSADAAKRVDDTFVPAIRATLGIAAAPIVRDAPPPKVVVETPAPEPKPAPVVTPAPPASVASSSSQGLGGAQIAGLAIAGAGVISLGVGIGMGVKALGAVGTQKQLCPPGQPCTNPAAYNSFNEARSAQSTGVIFAVVGGVLVAGGATLFLLNMGSSSVAVTPAASPDGAGVLMTGNF